MTGKTRIVGCLFLAAIVLVFAVPAISAEEETGEDRLESPSFASGEEIKSAASSLVSGGVQKHMPILHALKIKGRVPTLDGRLSEAAWEQAPVATGFVQFQPDVGAPATERSEVRVLYGKEALYVGFRAFEKDPGTIEAQLTRRDQMSHSDRLHVQIDSHNDKRTAYHFGVNAKGVKQDSYVFDDTKRDYDWNAVWDVAVSIDEQGWIAEFRIPYSQLRFPRAGEQTWGIQFSRVIARKNEIASWTPYSADGTSVVSSFGKLKGPDGIESPRLLEVMPYVLAELQRAPDDPENPFFEENDTSATLGMDVKYGLTGDLTLDVTVNPDFGQIEADPAQVNLGTSETFFPERRPFFLEGANIFNRTIGRSRWGMSDESLFYSRRIGRTPQGNVDPLKDEVEPFEGEANPYQRQVSVPDLTTIQVAEKLSGKTQSAWTIGLLHAATAEETAQIVTGEGKDIEMVVEPSTQYGLVRLQKDFQDGLSALGVIATGVFRSGAADAIDLPTNAVTGGLDFRHRFWDGNYQISGYVLGSQVSGSKEAISELQLAPARYMQRPDADHVTYDPERTSLDGSSASVAFGKISGGFWRYSAKIRSRTPGFEVNDMGFMEEADFIETRASLKYDRYLPTKRFRSWNLEWDGAHTQNHGNERTRLTTGISGRLQFLNYWQLQARVMYFVGSLSTGLLRGGPAFRTDDGVNVSMGIQSDYRSDLRFSTYANYAKFGNNGSRSYRISSRLSWRPAGRIQLSLGAAYNMRNSDIQWITQLDTDRAHYIFGHIEQQTVNLTGRLDFAFTPDLSLQIYLQPFVSAGRYSRFRQIADPRADNYEDRFDALETMVIPNGDPDDYNDYRADVDGNGIFETYTESFADPDFNFKQFHANTVLRWEYRPGSVLFAVWSHAREHSAETGQFDFGRNIGTLFSAPPDNVFMIKVSYYWF